MGIVIDQSKMRVHLQTRDMSYVIETLEGELIHSYWGKPITLPEHSPMIPIEEVNSFSPNPNALNKTYSLDVLPREYPDFGRSDYRNPGFRLRLEDGTMITKFMVTSFSQMEGKPKLMGLPSTYVEAGDIVNTLVVTMVDEKSQIKIELYYTLNETYNALMRSVRFINKGKEDVYIENALSASVDFYSDQAFDLIHFHGSWARERQMSRVSLGHDTHIIDSKRGASSHQQNPLLILARPEANNFTGDVYSMNFVYSGSFKGLVEVNPYNSTRMQMGINDFDFSWLLKPEGSFQTPEVVMVFSNEGFNGMSHIYHQLYLERLCRGSYRDQERPILINNWEATYFSFTQEKLEKIGTTAKEVGIELFVLDDGWFGDRNSDKSGLGDWFVNKEKLPKGLEGVADFMNEKGLKFGLWFEPEMISVNSQLYTEHPDWCLHVNNHTRSEARNQLVLDMSRTDVQDYLIRVISDILSHHNIEYVKWDMNRHMTEVGSNLLPACQQGEVSYRYMLGVYHVMEIITTRFSKVLFESCSGGGGRFDPGILYYMPQTWTSDDTDAYERQFIQYGTSFAYPQITMGAHVSVVPNHQVGRVTPLSTRGHLSMMANLGYELDLSELSDNEIETVKTQISLYKSMRRDIQFGRLYRLLSPYETNKTAFLIESVDQKNYYLFLYYGLNRPNQLRFRLPLHYLKPGLYSVSKDKESLGVERVEADYINADYLNAFGYFFEPQKEDFESQLIIITKVDIST